MKKATLVRQLSTEKETLGILSVENNGELFVCKTLELPWDKNINNASCVPIGEYACKWTRSNRMSAKAGHDVFTYELLSVPNRSGIRIHSANYFHQLLGCISLGDAHKDINLDGEIDVIHSGATVQAFNNLMNQQDFILTIL